ncbi:MAG: exodeoxyribonuclease V subunit alpha [Gemmatimonadaceae bacterium]|nr:exodeoxyribonuclease V subunit alpha [Gemmatimonadaceae bacterium]
MSMVRLMLAEQRDRIDAADIALAEVLVRRSEATGDAITALAWTAAALSAAARDGHSAIAPASAVPAIDGWDATRWTKALKRTPAVGDADSEAPIIITQTMVQLRRYRDAEKRLAAWIRSAVATTPPRLRIITGGPGSGKTTTIARELIPLTRANPALRVALAAPTGKAAARMAESIRERLDAEGADGAARPAVPTDAKTLHRLLRYHGATRRFRHAEDAPLGASLVIVDEASMVDLLLMDALVRALPDGAQLWLVGDAHQLASVDAGDVFGAICRAGAAASAGAPLREAVTTLTKNYRYERHPAIGALAESILAGDAERALAVLDDPAQSDVSRSPLPADAATLVAPLTAQLQRCAAAASPTELLSALSALRVLAPERGGRFGVERLNAAIEWWWRAQGTATDEPWYHRRPVLVTANDYATDVYNGDIGVVWRDGETTTVHFPAANGTTRAIAPARLPTVESAWAMTIHKAQGSEFDEVVVVLPEEASRVLVRESLYTAVTRAKQKVTVVGSAEVLSAAIDQVTVRVSGLQEALEPPAGRRPQPR